jgi:ABC-type glycerol-3-phosphate transport system substrate-binding protein
MKKFLALILALAMIFALAACGQSAAAPAAQEAAPAAQEAAPAEAAKEITINFPCIWVGTDSKAAYFA